jgi:hypothetical protein
MRFPHSQVFGDVVDPVFQRIGVSFLGIVYCVCFIQACPSQVYLGVLVARACLEIVSLFLVAGYIILYI